MNNRATTRLESLLLGCAMAVAAKAQPFVLSRVTDQPAGGFRLYSITGYASYGSLLPVLYTNQPQSSVGSKIEGGGSAALGWSASGPTTNLSLTFAPSFVSRPGVDTAYNLNSGLNLDTSMSTKLSPTWSLRFSVLGRFNDLEQSLFLPSSLTTISEVPSNSQDWATALSAGKYAANSPITSLAAAAPVVDSPTRTILYGDRILTVGLGTGVVYAASPRLSFAASFSATHTQSVPFDTPNAISQYALLTRSTSGTGDVGFSYALSPRSSLSVAASSSRSISKYQDTYVTTDTVSYSRLLSPQWFISVNGGSGFVTPIRQTGVLPTGAQYTAGGSIGFKTSAHAFVGSYSHTIADPYGLGAVNGQIISGSWTWARPRAKWYLQASGAWQSFDPGGGFLSSLNGWIGQAALGRALARDLSLSVQYAYLDNHGAIRNSVSHTIVGQGVRVSLTWTPVRTPWFVR